MRPRKLWRTSRKGGKKHIIPRIPDGAVSPPVQLYDYIGASLGFGTVTTPIGGPAATGTYYAASFPFLNLVQGSYDFPLDNSRQQHINVISAHVQWEVRYSAPASGGAGFIPAQTLCLGLIASKTDYEASIPLTTYQANRIFRMTSSDNGLEVATRMPLTDAGVDREKNKLLYLIRAKMTPTRPVFSHSKLHRFKPPIRIRFQAGTGNTSDVDKLLTSFMTGTSTDGTSTNRCLVWTKIRFFYTTDNDTELPMNLR